MMNSELMYFLKSDFYGLSGGETEHFTPEVIYTGNDSYFAADNFALNYTSYFLPDYMITGEYFDMSGLFEDYVSLSYQQYKEWYYTYTPLGNSCYVTAFEGSRFHSEEECAVRKKVYDTIASYIKEKIMGSSSKNTTFVINDPKNNNISKYLNVYSFRMFFGIGGSIGLNMMFAPDTGKPVSAVDIFGEKAEDMECSSIEKIEVNNGTVTVYYSKYNVKEIMNFDIDEVNMKYISIPGTDGTFSYS